MGFVRFLTCWVLLLTVGSACSFGRGTHHFFSSVSSSTRILSIFLSCQFSFSSYLKRLALAIFIRPYLRRHR